MHSQKNLSEQKSSSFLGLTESNKRLKRKIFDLYTIFEISRKLNSMLDLEDLLSGILETMIGQLGIRGAAIFIPEDLSAEELSVFKMRGIDLKGDTDFSEFGFRQDSDLLKLLLCQNEPLLLEEMRAHLKKGFGDLAVTSGPGSLATTKEIGILEALECELCIPLIGKNRIRGILSLTQKSSNRPFSDNDLEFISVLTDQFTSAVENAILYESQKSMNLQLRRTQKQLIQSEKLAALGQLSASIAHEVNNPLGIIKNYLLILSDSMEKGDTNQSSLEVVKEEVDRIARIVKSLLDFCRPKTENLSTFDLAETINQTVSLVEEQFLQRNIVVKRDFPEDLPKVKGLDGEIKQVFLNLLMNSKDFMPQGGRISISAYQNEDTVQIELSDTGSGIPQENISRVFEPFFTTKEEGKGTGLGLWICCGIIERHGGTIAAKRKDKGSSFLVTLPIASS